MPISSRNEIFYPNEACLPYSHLFSPSQEAIAIKENRFPLEKRKAPIKCEGKSDWLQPGSRCPVLYHGENSTILNNKDNLSNDQINYYKTSRGVVDLNDEGISVAIDRRISLFFQQAILCYEMSIFTFSTRGADDQIGSSLKITFKSHSNHSVTFKREAAHSSTIPTLIAHAKDGSTPEGFVYLKGGSSHFQHNATIGMHECVNGADELIDGNGNDNKLRSKAVKLLNSTASDGKTPVEVTKLFIEALKNQVNTTHNELQQKSSEDPRGFVLEKYLEKIKSIQNAVEDKDFFDNLLGVTINPEDPIEAPLRNIVYKKRYDAIRLQEIAENNIAKLIKDAQSKLPKCKGNYLEHILINRFLEQKERKILEKLFCKTGAIFEKDYICSQASFKAFKTKIENIEKSHKQIIDDLARDLRYTIRELSKAEFIYRAGVFKDLRIKVHNWTQKKFIEAYKNTTGDKISQAWVSRIEEPSRSSKKADYKTPIDQRRKFVTLDDVKKYSKTFGVDPGIFMPCFFTSG